MAQTALRISHADVREQATSGSAKPRRKACSAGRAAASPGLGEPQQASGNIQKDVAAHCLHRLSEIYFYQKQSWKALKTQEKMQSNLRQKVDLGKPLPKSTHFIGLKISDNNIPRFKPVNFFSVSASVTVYRAELNLE